ncbi:MAG: hypothetical protein JSS91_01090 [Bacteroidetes bacterium]|nr:hypothetical protein [Bacteroidota bacterium]
MEIKKPDCSKFLFPGKMKAIGIIVILLSIGMFFITKSFGGSVSFLGWYFMAAGLTLSAFSREKAEDEMTESVRLRSLMISVSGAIAFVMAFDLIRYFNDGSGGMSAVQFICLMIFFYIIRFRIEISKLI